MKKPGLLGHSGTGQANSTRAGLYENVFGRDGLCLAFLVPQYYWASLAEILIKQQRQHDD